MKKWDIAKYVRAGHQEFSRESTKVDVSRLPPHIFNDLEKKEASLCNPWDIMKRWGTISPL